MKDRNGGVEDAQFSPDGTRIVTAGRDDKTVRIWDADTGKLLKTLAALEGEVHSAQFSPDGGCIVSVSWSKSDCTAHVWDVATGKTQTTLAGHQAGVWRAHLSPDGKHIVTASDDKTARVWDVPQGETVPPPEWFPDFLRYVAQVRLNSDGELETLKPADLLTLRERLRGVLRTSADDDKPYLRILRRYVSE